MAARTSSSHTKSTGLEGGGAGCGGADGAGAVGHCLASQPYPPLVVPPRWARKRSTTSAETLATVAVLHAHFSPSQPQEGPPAAFAGAGLGAAVPTVNPREARYRSTAATTTARSTEISPLDPEAVG